MDCATMPAPLCNTHRVHFVCIDDMTDITTIANNSENIAHVAEAAGAHADSGIHIALAAERLGSCLSIPITTTLITSWGVMLILFVIAWLCWRNVTLTPGRI